MPNDGYLVRARLESFIIFKCVFIHWKINFTTKAISKLAFRGNNSDNLAVCVATVCSINHPDGLYFLT